MSKQGKKHMGGRRRYVKNMTNIPASRANVKEAFPHVIKKSVGKQSTSKTSFGKSTLPKRVGIKAVHKTVFGGKSKPSIVPKTPNMFGRKMTNIGTQPTRAMLGLK
jgi:hypothetical protein